KVEFSAGVLPQAVAIADLNADGRPDLATAIQGPSAVSVRLGKGDGTFGVGTAFGIAGYPTSVAAADLNGDGKPDLVTANTWVNTVSVLQGIGNGTFGAETAF